MVFPLILAAIGAALLLGKKGGLGKGGKIINFTRGTIGNLVIGAGAGAFVNGLDKKFGNTTLGKIGFNIGPVRLDATDAVVAAGTFGLRLPTKDGITILAGKKIAEFMKFIDPDPMLDTSKNTGRSVNVGART